MRKLPSDFSLYPTWEQRIKTLTYSFQVLIRCPYLMTAMLPEGPSGKGEKLGAIPIIALAAHRYSEIEQFVRLSEAVAYAIPERLGDFSFSGLARRVQREHACLRSVFVVGQTDQPGWVSLTELLQTESGLPRELLDEIEIDPLMASIKAAT
ncbi:MAG TPA: hypothetical protein VF026_02365 [Ktedonobacteraceae bacterium]